MLQHLSKIYFVFLISVIPTLVFSQRLSQEEKEVLELRDKRILGEEDRLINYLYSTNSNLRVNAIHALANIADSTTIAKLNFLLAGPFENYPTNEDLKALAFLLGQIPGQASREMLNILLNDASKSPGGKSSYLAKLLDSFGKIGEQEDLDVILSRYAQYSSDDTLSASLAMSIARFAIRKIKNKYSIDILKSLFKDPKDTMSLRSIAFAFWRIGEKDLLLDAKNEIFLLTQSPDAQTRMWAYNALGKLPEVAHFQAIINAYRTEQDWRVKINMLNALGIMKLDFSNEQLSALIQLTGKSENEHISIAALNLLGNLNLKTSSEIDKSSLLKILNSPEYNWRQKSEAANTLSLIFKDEVKNDLLKAFSNTDNFDLKSGILRAFSHFNDGLIYKEVRDSISAEVQRYNFKNPNITGELIGSNDLAKLYRAFVEMLSNLDDKVDDINKNIIRLIFSEFAGSKDPAIVDISVNALRDSLYLEYIDETSSVLEFDYGELIYPKDYEVMLVFIDAFGELKRSNFVSILEKNIALQDYGIAKSSKVALEKITGKQTEISANPRIDLDWSYMEEISNDQLVTIETNKGNIKIKLFREIAPFTVMNFLKLIEKNFYDGTIFHRVVSNFVIQGGDPTATGYGGPGYSIRSEFSPLIYERGMVGMASSGRDTEGSQFFITHSATPHLDGRYTIFGEVVDGIDVVDKIMIGDRIEDILIE